MSFESKKVEFASGHETLAARLELPEAEPSATAIFAHCFTCSKEVAAAARISRALARLGVAVLRFDFTGLGNSSGDFSNTNFSSNVDDLEAAARHLRSELMAPTLLVGHSLGGAAVLAAAEHIPEVRAVATIGAPSRPDHVKKLLRPAIPEIQAKGSAIVELGGREFPIRQQFLDDLERHELAERVERLDRALLVLHSPIDEIVSVEEARRIFEAARHPKSFVSLDRADHLLSKAADSEFVAGILAAWFPRYLPDTPR